ARSEEAGAAPGLAQDMLGQEREDGLVPDGGVTGGEDPVVLIREVQELGFGAVLVQVPPQPERLADRDAEVLVAVDDQHRRRDAGHGPGRRILLVALRGDQGGAELRSPHWW